MRRWSTSAIGFLIATALATLGSIIWVDRTVAATLERPKILCLTQRDREMIARDQFSEARQDSLVIQAANFQLGVPRMLWWHARGLLIQLTYETFWSDRQRRKIFRALVTRVKSCSD